jgi:hypothetical protein
MEIRNPKPKIRNKTKIQVKNAQNVRDQRVLVIGISDFEFVSDLRLEISAAAAHAAFCTAAGGL